MSSKTAALTRAPVGVVAMLTAIALQAVSPSVAAAQNTPTLTGLNVGPGRSTLVRPHWTKKPFYCSMAERNAEFDQAKADQLMASRAHTILQAQHAALAALARGPAPPPGIYQQISNLEVMMRQQDDAFIDAGEHVRAIRDTRVVVCANGVPIAMNAPQGGALAGAPGRGEGTLLLDPTAPVRVQMPGNGTQILGPTAPVKVQPPGGGLAPRLVRPGAPLLVGPLR